MVNETAMQASYNQKNPDSAEFLENIPPRVTAAPETSKVEVQAVDISEENGPLSDAYSFSTPAPRDDNRGKKEKSELSGFQSALTPILKHLNIDNNRLSPESLKHVFSKKQLSKSTGKSAHHPSSDLSTTPLRKTEGGKGAPVCLLDFEYLPEVTFLDVTNDPTVELSTNEPVLCESAPVIPKVGNENNAKPPDSPKPAEKTSLNPHARIVVLSNNPSSSVCSRITETYLPEITLLDVSRDSELSPVGQISSFNITQDTLPLANMNINKAVSELREETESLDTVQNEKLSSARLQSINCVRENAIKISLEVTEDIILGNVVENSLTSSELSGKNEKPQVTDEKTLDANPVNITHVISSSHEMPVQCSGLSSCLECNSSSKSVISEWDSKFTENPDTVEDVNEELLTDCDTDTARKVSQQNTEMDVSKNGTLTVLQPSNLSASSDLSSTASISCPDNKTLDLATPSVDSLKECESTDETQSATKKLPCIVNQNYSAGNESNQHKVQNATFDHWSPQKSSSNTILPEDVTTNLHLQNNTFDCKPPSQQNATITLSENSSSDSHHNTLDKTSSPKVCSLTISLKDKSSEVHPREMPKQNAITVAAEPNVSMQKNPNSSFEANPVLESVSGSGEREGRDHSESGLPVTQSLSDASSHQSMETENNKGDTFNLDETLDLKADPMITSTPMPNCKLFHCDKEREADKILAVQKKLYGDGPSKPDDQPPSNIVCDRKTLFTQNTPRFLKPPLKVTSQLLKNKPGSTLLGRLEPVTSGLPVKKQRIQPEPVRNAASQESQGTTGLSGSYSLRSTTAASKLPSSGLQRPQPGVIPSVVQRAGPGLRPPSARSNTMSSSTEKPCGPTAANAVTRNAQGKKHQLTRGHALPVTKRKKMDPGVPSSITETTASACNSYDSTNKTRNMKQPTTSQRSLPAKSQRNDAAVPSAPAETSASCDDSSRGRAIKQPATSHRALLAKPQNHGCAKCSTLEGQLKEKSEEIQRLKAELLKYK
ncbi:uncharacterized protein LOC121633052 [Melanotaenia boesemani]|uniref:uncharacterized protein LOC121633052 n=1 Tax=Melanotaenia boesemani TaxID=1250792 RepID=UPI001C052C86|nr:uncharacterized protein LOC121633052 [Melanotaenia boesemani]